LHDGRRSAGGAAAEALFAPGPVTRPVPCSRRLSGRRVSARAQPRAALHQAAAAESVGPEAGCSAALAEWFVGRRWQCQQHPLTVRRRGRRSEGYAPRRVMRALGRRTTGIVRVDSLPYCGRRGERTVTIRTIKQEMVQQLVGNGTNTHAIAVAGGGADAPGNDQFFGAWQPGNKGSTRLTGLITLRVLSGMR